MVNDPCEYNKKRKKRDVGELSFARKDKNCVIMPGSGSASLNFNNIMLFG